MRQQSVITHTICQTQIPARPDSWVKDTPFVKMLYPQKITSPYTDVKT